MVRLQGVGEKALVRILDQQGKQVAEGHAGTGEIDFRGKPAGVYRIVLSGDGSMKSLQLAVP
jgi:hypothetical protein